jgi:hypothetical protein
MLAKMEKIFSAESQKTAKKYMDQGNRVAVIYADTVGLLQK